jgi:hypothetical protein
MSSTVNSAASTADFEFTALSYAKNYRAALAREFRPHLKGRIIEIGAGIGQMTSVLKQSPGVTEIVAIEPDERFHQSFSAENPETRLVKGIARDFSEKENWNAVVSINVLEHIENDVAELREWHNLISGTHGFLCLFVPARPEIYAPIDQDFGHFRRYKKSLLAERLSAAGYTIERLNYFNSVGYFAWWFNFCLLKQRTFNFRNVWAYDRLIFPMVHAFESWAFRPPIGQSLIAIARAK